MQITLPDQPILDIGYMRHVLMSANKGTGKQRDRHFFFVVGKR